jgi:putative FmdB family regulatory protein
MPTYEYECVHHGVFETMRSMKESSFPQPCPDCGRLAPRVVVTAAAFAGTPAAQRTAHAINERSASEPKTSASMRHKSGCSCCSSNARSSTTVKLPDGSKSFPSKRPWMISH